MSFGSRASAFIGRIFLSAIFLLSGVNKIISWEATQDSFLALINDWSLYVSGIYWAEDMFAQLRAWIIPLLGVATALELIGGLCLFFGIKVKFGSFLLIIFLIPVTFLYHNFWFYAGQRRELELIMFLKNIAIMGGLFSLLAYHRPFPRLTNSNLDHYR